MELGLVVVVLLVAGGIVVGSVVVQQRRTQAMRAAAAALGLRFEGRWTELRITGLGAHSLFCTGSRRSVQNAMTGSVRGVELAVIDYDYTVGSGKSRRTLAQTVCWLRIPDARLPTFVLRPERLFDKIGAAFGAQDIDFEGHPEFSRRYLLRGQDEPAVRRVFAPPVLTHFETHEASVEAFVDKLIVYDPDTYVAPTALAELVERALEIRELFATRSA